MTLIFRDKYLFGAVLFIYPVLFFFLDQWEQTTSSFPCWEMKVGLFNNLSAERRLGSWFPPGVTLFFLHYDCFLLTFTVISAAKQHSIVLVCNSSPRESQWAHLKMWSVAWGMVLIVLAIIKWEGCWEGTNKESCFLIYVECRMLSPPSAFTKSVIYSHCYQHLL